METMQRRRYGVRPFDLVDIETTYSPGKYHPDNSLVCATISVASTNLDFTTTSKGNGRLQYTMKIVARKPGKRPLTILPHPQQLLSSQE